MERVATGAVTLSPKAPTNRNTYVYNINVLGDVLPDQLMKLVLNGKAHSNQDAENNTIEAALPDYDIQPVGDNLPEVTAANEAAEPEIHEYPAGSPRTSPEEQAGVIPSAGEEMVTLEPSGDMSREIMKCIVYGGLTELVTSMGIVTSAASTHATTGKVVALSFASLIVGLFVLGYKMSELWMMNKQPTRAEQTEAKVEQYEELLGDRQNYRLHFTVAISSFLLFGLVPPLVYGFTFPKPEDKDFKILAVTGVSMLCIALLAILKAHIQRPENCVVYIYFIGNYVIDVLGTAGVTSLAGGLIEKYIEHSGWFEPIKTPTLYLYDTGFANRTWGTF